MLIYVDFDDVLCETARALSGLAADLFGRRVPYEAIGAFDLRDAFALAHEQYRLLMEQAHREEFLAALPPADGAESHHDDAARGQCHGVKPPSTTRLWPVT